MLSIVSSCYITNCPALSKFAHMAEESDLPLQRVAKKYSEDLSYHGEEKAEATEGQVPDDEMLTMVSHFYDSVKSLTDFHSQYPKLTTLYVTGIPLDSLNGVQHIPNLTHLFAMKCKLKNVSAVEECYHLEKLCLYSNAIQEIPDLKYVQKLKTLWLSGNEISCIKNLESQKNLRELYLNNNKIKEIGSSLLENKNLQTLNLAANPIFSLKEIIKLAELPSLTSLILADSQHDMQPMTELLNYSSYIIYHLHKLEILDGYPIDQKERSRVTLFYSNLLLQYRIIKYKLLGDYYKEIWIKQEENREALAKFKKWYHIYTSLAAQIDKGGELQCNLQRDDIKTRFEYLSIEVKNWDAEVAEYMAFLSTMKKIRLTQLNYELENANNLKFIGYEPDNEIVEIFNTIMNSYCCSHIERQYDIVGIQVVRVTQIINNSFKAMMRSYSTQDLTRDAIMLVSPTPVTALSDWPFHVLERGFMVNKPLSVSVTDCLDFADASWMNTLQKLRQRNISLTEQIQNSIRVTIIVKLPEELPPLRNRKQLYTSEEDQEPPDPSETTGLHVSEPTDPKKCQVYCIANSSDVIPAYVVEYKYKYKEDKLKLLQQNIGLDVHSCYVSFQEPYAESCKLSLETLESYLPRPIVINYLREIRLVGCNLRTLDENLPNFPSLVSLNLSCNQIRDLPRMDIFPRLKKLELSYNNLTDIKQMTVAPSLESLNISWNKISEILSVFTTLKSCARNLNALRISHNPIEDVIHQNHILYFAAKYLHRLQTLDDNSPHIFIQSFHNIKIEGSQMDSLLKQKSNKIVAISLKWKAEICNHIHEEQNMGLAPQNTCSTSWISMNNQNLAKVILMQVNPGLQWIDLSYNYIDDMSFLCYCPNAKEISLESNVITELGLAVRTLKNLTYLNISQNYLTSLEGISNGDFPCLQLLDVSSNNLTDLNGIEFCTALQECYFSSNMIAEYDDLSSIKDCKMLRIIDMTGNPVDSKRNALSYIIYRNQNIEIVNGYQIQPADIVEASQVYCGILDKNYLMKELYSTDLSKLREVTLTHCAIKKIELPGDVLPSVLSIDLSNNNLTCLSGLHELPQLQTLCLSGNKVTEMGLSEDSNSSEIYPQLKTLYLDNNGIFSITSLELGRLRKLTRLYLQCNMIENLQGLEGILNLIALVLDWNRITSVTRDQVSSFSGLNELHLERNKISNLSFLKPLKQIQRLYLSYNKIHDFDQLKYVAALNNLEELTLIANPICPHHTSYHDLTAVLPRFYIYIHSCDSDELPL